MTVFGDVNVSVHGNSDVIKFTLTFKCVLLENQKCNYFNHLLYIAALFLLFIPVSFIKFNPLSLSWYFFFLQNSRKVLFQAATSQSGKQLHVPRTCINTTFKNLNIYKPNDHFTTGHVCLEISTQGRSPLLSVKISLFDVFKQLLTLHKLTPTSDATSVHFTCRKMSCIVHHTLIRGFRNSTVANQICSTRLMCDARLNHIVDKSKCP